MRRVLITIFLLLNSYQCVLAGDLSNDQISHAIVLLQHKKYTDAEKLLISASDFKGRFLTGVAQFRQEKYNYSRVSFLRATYLADNDSDRFNSLYNAAVSSFFSGNYADAHRLFIDARNYEPANKNIEPLIAISQTLYEMVLNNQETARRNTERKQAGSGKKLVSLDDVNFDREAAVRFTDKKEKVKIAVAGNDLLIRQAELQKLLEKGIDAIKLDKSSMISPVIENEFITTLTSAPGSTEKTPANNQYLLWKRMFELEQNIPAPLEKQIILPGVNPW